MVYWCFNLVKKSKNTSITKGDYFDDFIQSMLKEGRYKNTSEAVRAGLRLLEEEEQKSSNLKSAIQQGLDSGIIEDFNPTEYLKVLKANRKK